MPSALRSLAIAIGLVPPANMPKTRFTTAASRGLMARSPQQAPPFVRTPKNVIAVASPPGGLAGFDPAALSPMGLLGQVLEEKGIHCALQANVQLRDLTFGQSDDTNAGKPEVLKQRRDIGLISRQPVKGFRHHDIKLPFAGSLDQGLIARTEARGPADRGVLKCLHQSPSFAGEEFPAKPDLVVYRRLALIIRRVSRLDGYPLAHATHSVTALRYLMIDAGKWTV